MADICKWGFGCGRRTPSDTDELEAWQAPGEDMNATCWTGWGCKDPHCDRLRIERLESALTAATARAEAAEAKVEMIRVVALGSLPGCRPFDDAAKALGLLSPPQKKPTDEGGRGETCPNCGAPEVPAQTPRTTYACGSSDYDQRPGTFAQKCASK